MRDSKFMLGKCEHGNVVCVLAMGLCSAREDAKSIAKMVRDGLSIETAKEMKLPIGCPECGKWKSKRGTK